MHIVITHPFSWPYVRRGTERNMEGLAAYLGSRGHEVTIVSTCPDGPRVITEKFGTRILHPPRWHPLLGKIRIPPTHTFFPDCWRSLAELGADVVHSFYFTDALAANLRRKRCGFGTVFQMNGAPLPEAHYRFFPPDRWLIRKAIANCNRRIVCSEFVRELVQRFYGLDSQTIVPGVNIQEFDFGSGPEDGVPTLLAVGNFDVRRKGIRVLAEAFNLVNREQGNCRLRISGHMSNSVRDEIFNLLDKQARENVEILGLGQLEDVPGLYRDSSLLVVPAIYEPSGGAMTEALASGTPVVAANHGGLPEYLSSEVGVLYEPGILGEESRNSRGLAEAILKGLELSASKGTREKCRHLAQSFSWEATGPCIEEVYQQAIGDAK